MKNENITPDVIARKHYERMIEDLSRRRDEELELFFQIKEGNI